MPIDPTGTAPGLVAQEKKEERLAMRCRQSKCDSMEAVEMHIPGYEQSGVHMYRCVKCKNTWNTNLGSSFNF